MSRNLKNDTNWGQIQKYVTYTMGFLLVVFIVAQFVVLDLAGMHGPEITRLRREQEQAKLENDLKRAQINEMKVSGDIEYYAKINLKLVPASVKTIEVNNQDQKTVAVLNHN